MGIGCTLDFRFEWNNVLNYGQAVLLKSKDKGPYYTPSTSIASNGIQWQAYVKIGSTPLCDLVSSETLLVTIYRHPDAQCVAQAGQAALVRNNLNFQATSMYSQNHFFASSANA
jgi:hypothetical protein